MCHSIFSGSFKLFSFSSYCVYISRYLPSSLISYYFLYNIIIYCNLSTFLFHFFRVQKHDTRVNIDSKLFKVFFTIICYLLKVSRKKFTISSRIIPSIKKSIPEKCSMCLCILFDFVSLNRADEGDTRNGGNFSLKNIWLHSFKGGRKISRRFQFLFSSPSETTQHPLSELWSIFIQNYFWLFPRVPFKDTRCSSALELGLNRSKLTWNSPQSENQRKWTAIAKLN